MTVSLILLITVHVFLVLTAAIFFYGLLLKLLARKGSDRKTMLFYALLGFVTAALSIFAGSVPLRDYYNGLLGSLTDPSVTTLMPFFIAARSVLLLLLILSALLILIIIWMKGDEVNQNKRVKNILIAFTILAVVSAAVLPFLGILVP